ncbi:MAG: hypothetical protein KAH84_09300 [Thiomargarita sp.]|nr:hypothetical protein [Thiomargarita sp.]
MKHWFQIFRLILWRDIYPARDSAGWKGRITFNLLVSLLPTGGIIVILLASAIFGLYLVMETQRVTQHLAEVRESPYMALFAEGFFDDAGENKGGAHRLSTWRQMELKELKLSSKTTLPKETLLFNGVFPFSRTSLNIRRADGQHFEGWKGLALAFERDNEDTENINEGFNTDVGLLKEIEKHAQTKDWQIPANNNIEGIIVSKQLLKELGYQQAPEFIWMHLPRKTRDIPIKVLAVTEKLPYQVWYVMSFGQWARLDTNIYYDNIKGGFDISYPNGLNDRKAEEQLIKQNLSFVEKIKDITLGSMLALDIHLKDSTSTTWLDVMEFIATNSEQQRQIRVPISKRKISLTQYYNGTMFHLNPVVLGAKEILEVLQTFMDDKMIKVRGELMQALQVAFQDQRNLEKTYSIFRLAFLLLFIIITFFFAVVLHSRLNRIGILRILGVSNGKFIAVYSILTFLFVIFAFIAALLLFAFTVNMSYLHIWGVAELFILVTFFATVGILLPVIYFLNTMSPAEMVTYRI